MMILLKFNLNHKHVLRITAHISILSAHQSFLAEPQTQTVSHEENIDKEAKQG